MGEKLQSTFNLVQRMGFFWEYPKSKPLQAIIDSIDQKRIQRAAQKTVNLLTDLIEGNYSAIGLRMAHALELDSLEKVWQYRTYLIKRFDAQLPTSRKTPIWLTHDSADEYKLGTIVKAFERALDRRQYVEGVIIDTSHKISY
ncbi:hypothetical protein KY333_02240 [Candidatus Woesearchaeota archaeon]|nr:hypothetical protein [Candidatus Woesearchaeota archaeon]MBW2994029.1 hypothetical protein [Candidatus Woesearchaeota archaeon]